MSCKGPQSPDDEKWRRRGRGAKNKVGGTVVTLSFGIRVVYPSSRVNVQFMNKIPLFPLRLTHANMKTLRHEVCIRDKKTGRFLPRIKPQVFSSPENSVIETPEPGNHFTLGLGQQCLSFAPFVIK